MIKIDIKVIYDKYLMEEEVFERLLQSCVWSARAQRSCPSQPLAFYVRSLSLTPAVASDVCSPY
jgi:hypothetical protein